MFIHLATVATGAGNGWGRLTDAIEVITFGAVGPVFAFGGAKFLGTDLGNRLAGVGCVGQGIAVDHAVNRLALRGGLEGAGGCVLFRLEKGVLVQHLADFLVQLQRRQLQQADGLLQLGRERQMLGQPDLK